MVRRPTVPRFKRMMCHDRAGIRELHGQSGRSAWLASIIVLARQDENRHCIHRRKHELIRKWLRPKQYSTGEPLRCDRQQGRYKYGSAGIAKRYKASGHCSQITCRRQHLSGKPNDRTCINTAVRATRGESETVSGGYRPPRGQVRPVGSNLMSECRQCSLILGRTMKGSKSQGHHSNTTGSNPANRPDPSPQRSAVDRADTHRHPPQSRLTFIHAPHPPHLRHRSR